MKYTVPHNSSLIEFSTLESATEFAITNNISTSLIQETPNDPSPVKTPQEIFDEKIEYGFPVPNTPFRLAMGDLDRVQFSSMIAMINEAYRYGYATGSTPTTIRDVDGNMIPITMEDFQKLMVAYGSYYIQLWNEKNA